MLVHNTIYKIIYKFFKIIFFILPLFMQFMSVPRCSDSP